VYQKFKGLTRNINWLAPFFLNFAPLRFDIFCFLFALRAGWIQQRSRMFPATISNALLQQPEPKRDSMTFTCMISAIRQPAISLCLVWTSGHWKKSWAIRQLSGSSRDIIRGTLSAETHVSRARVGNGCRLIPSFKCGAHAKSGMV
jgi:hypothetical protein